MNNISNTNLYFIHANGYLPNSYINLLKKEDDAKGFENTFINESCFILDHHSLDCRPIT